MAFVNAAGLVRVMEACSQSRSLNLQRYLSRFNLLLLYEPGPVSLSRTGAEPLFELFSQRYERGSVMATTNLPFDSDRLTEALPDQLTLHAHILEMNGGSRRLKHRRENTPSHATDDTDEE